MKWGLTHTLFSILTIYFKSVHMNPPNWWTWSCLLVYLPESVCVVCFASGQACHLEICHSDSVRMSWTAFHHASVAALLVIDIHHNQLPITYVNHNSCCTTCFPSFLFISLSLSVYVSLYVPVIGSRILNADTILEICDCRTH